MKNQKEIYEALLAGETLINSTGKKIKIEHDGNTTYGICIDDSLFPFEDWQIYKEPKWYENIPEGGVLCLVMENTFKRLINILSYDDRKNITHKYISEETVYRTVTPLTKQEIQVFMDNTPEQ